MRASVGMSKPNAPCPIKASPESLTTMRLNMGTALGMAGSGLARCEKGSLWAALVSSEVLRLLGGFFDPLAQRVAHEAL